MSLAPILAYEPTFGTIFGGAIFLDRPLDPKYHLHTRAAFSTNSEYSVLFTIQRWLGENSFYSLDAELDNFARPYYGEGMKTRPSDRILLRGTTARVEFILKWKNLGKITMGPYLDYRCVDVEEIDGNQVTPPAVDEASLGIGMNFFYDNRDNPLSPTRGVYDNLILRLVPDALTTYEGSKTFFQAEVDGRMFTSPVDGLVLAGRLHAGGSWGEPSYKFRYSLGGPYALKGFFTNRFRGDKFYMLQGEARKSLFGNFSGTAFVEAGEATDEWFSSPQTSFGVGLRATLPPGHVAKVRLDFAWAEDQHSIYFIFGETF
jgi:outer membrane protein assembly factor BamA